MPKPDLSGVPAFYHNYILKIHEEDVKAAIQDHNLSTVSFLQKLPSEKWNYAYAEGKWTIKELVQHMIDGERVFAYRALRFSRKDLTPLPGFDENLFAANSKSASRSEEDLLEEIKCVSMSSLHLFKSFDEEQLQFTGISNGSSISVNAIGFIIAGHARHHLDIISERYL
jgi:hypothetical protein